MEKFKKVTVCAVFSSALWMMRLSALAEESPAEGSKAKGKQEVWRKFTIK
jgi:hypothetical protein